MNTDGRGCEGVRGLAQIPREQRGEDGDDVQGDQPHGQIHGEEIGEERYTASLRRRARGFAGRQCVAVFLHQQQVELKNHIDFVLVQLHYEKFDVIKNQQNYLLENYHFNV